MKCAAILAMACATTQFGFAQEITNPTANDFPNRTIRIIVPTAAGGGNDFMGRYVALKLSERFGRQVIVENRPGAAGLIGSQLTANAPPDGYTLLMASTSFSMVAAIQKLSFDPIKSFSPIASVSVSPSALSVSPTLPVKSIKELVILAKSRPGELKYASAGVGSFNHLSGELFKLATGVDIVHVPYKGGPPGIADVIAGHIEVLSSTLPAALPHLRSHKLKGLGVGSLKRFAALPNLPSISETVPGYESVIWWGLLAPVGVPVAIVSKLNAQVGMILASPDTTTHFTNQAAEPLVGSPDTFGRMIAADIQKWRQVTKSKHLGTE